MTHLLANHGSQQLCSSTAACSQLSDDVKTRPSLTLIINCRLDKTVMITRLSRLHNTTRDRNCCQPHLTLLMPKPGKTSVQERRCSCKATVC
jgi:hypothetical protein